MKLTLLTGGSRSHVMQHTGSRCLSAGFLDRGDSSCVPYLVGMFTNSAAVRLWCE